MGCKSEVKDTGELFSRINQKGINQKGINQKGINQGSIWLGNSSVRFSKLKPRPNREVENKLVLILNNQTS